MHTEILKASLDLILKLIFSEMTTLYEQWRTILLEVTEKKRQIASALNVLDSYERLFQNLQLELDDVSASSLLDTRCHVSVAQSTLEYLKVGCVIYENALL